MALKRPSVQVRYAAFLQYKRNLLNHFFVFHHSVKNIYLFLTSVSMFNSNNSTNLNTPMAATALLIDAA